ncbi:MAG: hypothetical protein ACI8PZ_007475, partial [Myxococcota bacterium]
MAARRVRAALRDWPKISCAAPRGLQGVQGKEDDGGE